MSTTREFNFVVVATVTADGVIEFGIDHARLDACVSAVYEYPSDSDQYDNDCDLRDINDEEETQFLELENLLTNALIDITYPTK